MIFPLRELERALFESIMPVALTLSTVLFSNLYFEKLEDNFLKEGIMLGGLWLAISIGVDLLMFMQGPMKMTLIDYIKDIGLTYLIIPTITIGSGYLIEKFRQN